MTIASLFRKWFPPFEVRVTCQDIDSFLRADNGLCIDHVRPEAVALAKNVDKTLYSIRITGYKPDQLALILIYNVLTRRLQSGASHVYRGLLSMEGQDMLRLWHVTAKEMVKRGYLAAQEYETEVVGLKDELQAVG